METWETAANLYESFKNDGSALAKLTTARDALAWELATGADRLEVTSFTLNGQSASGTLRATKAEQHDILCRVVEMLTNGGAQGAKTVPVF